MKSAMRPHVFIELMSIVNQIVHNHAAGGAYVTVAPRPTSGYSSPLSLMNSVWKRMRVPSSTWSRSLPGERMR